MPVKLENFSPFGALQDFQRTLGKITPASGYNTRPTILEGPVTSSNVKGMSFPAIYVELLAYEGSGKMLGGYNSFTENGYVHVAVWGYVKTSGDRKRALMELFADVLEALWADETRQGDAVLTNLHLVEFTESFLANENIGMMMMPYGIQVQLDRGAG